MNSLARRVSGSRILLAGLLAMGLCLLARPEAGAQAPAGSIPFAGTQVFRRHVLHDLFKLVPATTPAEIYKKPQSSLLVVFGETQSLDKADITPHRLDAFLAQGGAVLIASDRPDAGLLRSWGLSIPGKLVHQNEQAAYRLEEGCPLLDHFTEPRHPLFQGLTRGLATNQPSYLVQVNLSLQVLATFPRTCWIAQDHGVRVGLGDFAPYIAGSDRSANSPGRMLVIAGHGAFMNGMMAQPDNDNLIFACNCVRWLTEGGKRKRVLFLEEGTVQGSFDVPLQQLPLPPIPSSQIINKIVRGLEEENFFNRLLANYLDPIKRTLVLLLSGLLLVYGLARLLRARQPIEPGVPLLAGGTLPAQAELPVMNQRYRDVVRGGNLWEAARDLARSCFDKVGEPWHGHAARVPPMVVAVGWRRRLRLARKVRHLWELAHGQPLPVLPGQFARVAADVREVQAALAAGTLRFEVPASPEKRLTGQGPTL